MGCWTQELRPGSPPEPGHSWPVHAIPEPVGTPRHHRGLTVPTPRGKLHRAGTYFPDLRCSRPET